MAAVAWQGRRHRRRPAARRHAAARAAAARPSRSIEEIKLVFERNKGAIYAIYNRALREDPALQGKVVLELKIAPSGEVVDVRIVSSELKASELERKLLARIRQFDFGAKDVDVMVVVLAGGLPALVSPAFSARYHPSGHATRPLRMHPFTPSFDFAPYRLSGTVYGVLLNHAPALAALGDAVNAAPYKAPPKAPVLYLKPRNTLAARRSACALPAGVDALQIGANLGIVIGRTACRVAEADALSHVAGYVVVDDLSVPHESFYRPSVRFKALDGSCVIGTPVARERIANPDALAVRVFVDGELVQRTDTGAARPPGGAAAGRHHRLHDAGAGRHRAARHVARRADGARGSARRDRDRRPRPRRAHACRRGARPSDGAARMKRAAQGARMNAPVAYSARSTRPRRMRKACAWPTAASSPKTRWSGCRRSRSAPIIALGLNYADHAKELAFKAAGRAAGVPQGPERASIGHRGQTRRPDGRAVHALRVRAGGGDRHARRKHVQARRRDATTSPATPWPTTTRSATTWRTGTGPTCA